GGSGRAAQPAVRPEHPGPLRDSAAAHPPNRTASAAGWTAVDLGCGISAHQHALPGAGPVLRRVGRQCCVQPDRVAGGGGHRGRRSAGPAHGAPASGAGRFGQERVTAPESRMLGRVLAAARPAAAPGVEVLRATTSLSPGRRVWHRDGLCYLEVRGLHRPGTEAIAQELADRLTSLEGVHHATVNPALGRVVIRFDPDVVDVSAFHPLINDLEAQHDLTGIPRASVNHPGNAEVLLQDFTALAAEFFGVGFAALSAVLPVRTAPSAVVSSLSLLDSV